jgi:pyruvate,orthophosphate dikinase
MMVAKGILTARGGLVSHAAVVARGWGTPAIVGADSVHIDGKMFSVGDTVVREGDVISLDGTTGEVMIGAMALAAAEPTKEFHTILKQMPTLMKMRLRRANMGQRVLDCAAPSTCFWLQIACRSCDA